MQRNCITELYFFPIKMMNRVSNTAFLTVFRIRRIRKFLELPDPDTSINKQKF
jgi:hypothetical protein